MNGKAILSASFQLCQKGREQGACTYVEKRRLLKKSRDRHKSNHMSVEHIQWGFEVPMLHNKLLHKWTTSKYCGISVSWLWVKHSEKL